MSLERWLKPVNLEDPASAFPAYPASERESKTRNAENAGNASSVPSIVKVGFEPFSKPFINGDPRGPCIVCGHEITDADRPDCIPVSGPKGTPDRYLCPSPQCYWTWLRGDQDV